MTGDSDSDFSVYLDLEYADGSHEYRQTAQFATGTTTWQRAQKLITLQKPPKLATVYVLLRGGHNGTAYFADVSLKMADGLPGPTMLTDGTVKAMPYGVLVKASKAAPTSLAVEARFEGRPHCIAVTGTVARTDTSLSTDRAVSISLMLPVDATGWHFPADLNADVVLGPEDDAHGLQYQNAALPFPTDFYPFMALHNDAVGLAAGVAVDGPVFVSRASYVASRKGFIITADFALTQRSQRFPNVANFSFVFFRIQPPRWGFRAALQTYYGLYSAFSENVIKDQGVWLVGNSNVDSIENHSDFGFKFDEGGGSPAECRMASAAGIGVFPYIEPHLIHWALPKGSTVDYPHILASVHSCMANATCTQRGKAKSVLSAGVVDSTGQYRWRTEDAAWNFGCVFWVDLDPTEATNPTGPVANMIRVVQTAYATASRNNYTLGGIYIDSVANAQNLVNYDPKRIQNANYPLLFDTRGRPVVLMLQNTLAFLLHLSEVVLAPHNGVLMGNGPYYPETQYRFAPVFAVSGGETFWFDPAKGRDFTPTDHALLSLHRVMAYQRPYLPLQDSDFFNWSYEMSSQYHQVELTFGMWPGYFSGDAADNTYFDNETWYNRDRPLFRRYVPVLREINLAGWEPQTSAMVATASPPAKSRVWVERFGPTAEGIVYFTVRNEGRPDLAKSLVLMVVDGTALGLETGRHTVVEMTRQRSCEIVAVNASSMAIPLNLLTVGGVAINETIVLKVTLKAGLN